MTIGDLSLDFHRGVSGTFNFNVFFEAEGPIPVTPTPSIAPTVIPSPTPVPTAAPAPTPIPVSTPTPAALIFTHTGLAQQTTPSFQVSSSPWKLEYQADWDGTFQIVLRPVGQAIVTQSVVGGVKYETFVHEQIGDFYFEVTTAPSNGVWTLWVLE